MSFAAQMLQQKLREARASSPPPGDDTDVRLLVGGALSGSSSNAVVLRAHLFVLSTVSPVFKQWFMEAQGASANGSAADGDADAHEGAGQDAVVLRPAPRRPITIELADFPPEAVSLALEVMYGGAFDGCHDWETAANCWDFAVRFQVAVLEKVARRKALQSLNLQNALHLLAYSLSVEDEAAIDTVADYIAEPDTFLTVIASRDFLFAPGPVLDALTIRPGPGSLVPDSDCTVEKAWFDALMRWLRVTKAQLSGSRDGPDTQQQESAENRTVEAAPAAQGHLTAAAAAAAVAAQAGQAEVGSAMTSGTNPAPEEHDQHGPGLEQRGLVPAEDVLKPSVHPRMRHVDHVLELVEFTRMKTEEVAMCAEEVTACHAARFPNCLIPLLVERTLVLEQERGERERENRELNSAYRSAVYAKNEAERNEVVVKSRLEKVEEERKSLRETLDATALRQAQQAPLQELISPGSRSPSPSAVQRHHRTPSAQSPAHVPGAQPFDSDDGRGEGQELSGQVVPSDQSPLQAQQRRRRRRPAEERAVHDSETPSVGRSSEANFRDGEDEGASGDRIESASGERAGDGTGVRGNPQEADKGRHRQVAGYEVSEGMAAKLASSRLVDDKRRSRRKQPKPAQVTGAGASTRRSRNNPYYGEPAALPIPTPRGNYWGVSPSGMPQALIYRPGQYYNGGYDRVPGQYTGRTRQVGTERGREVGNTARDPEERARRVDEILMRNPQLCGYYQRHPSDQYLAAAARYMTGIPDTYGQPQYSYNSVANRYASRGSVGLTGHEHMRGGTSRGTPDDRPRSGHDQGQGSVRSSAAGDHSARGGEHDGDEGETYEDDEGRRSNDYDGGDADRGYEDHREYPDEDHQGYAEGGHGGNPEGEHGDYPEGEHGDYPEGEHGDYPEGEHGDYAEGGRGDYAEGEHEDYPEGQDPEGYLHRAPSASPSASHSRSGSGRDRSLRSPQGSGDGRAYTPSRSSSRSGTSKVPSRARSSPNGRGGYSTAEGARRPR